MAHWFYCSGMRRSFTILLIAFLLFNRYVDAQSILANGGFEQWRLKEFKCCGRNIDSPWDWGMAENLTGLNYNKFVFRETDSFYVHSGIMSTRLYSDTTYLNGLVLIPGIISYGGMADSASTRVTIGPVIKAGGFPISSNPSLLNFYMMMSHAEPDTPYYVYLFTRWNMVDQKEDTLSYAQVDLPDSPENMNQWISYTDTIKYTGPGTADTVRLIFFGGRFGNSSLQGNATFLDDVSFYYPTTGLVSLDGSPVIEIYPNPASNLLTVKTGQYKTGNELRLFDAEGRNVKSVPVENYSTAVDISGLSTGEYLFRLSDKTGTFLTGGKLNVVK